MKNLRRLMICVSLLVIAAQALAVPAALPRAADVPVGAASGLDGYWRVSGINKRVRIEGSRAVVVDPWLHLFLFKVEPGMVVVKDIRRDSDGSFVGEDLPLMGPWRAKLNKLTRTLHVVVQGAMGETRYTMTRASGEDVTDEEEVYEEEEAEPERVKPVVQARKIGAASNLGCPGKQNYFSTVKGGSCWRCPTGYKRTARAMDHPKACKKRKSITGPWIPATFNGRAWGCPSGQFHVGLPTGGSCYKCPAGYKRIHTLGVDSLACHLQ